MSRATLDRQKCLSVGGFNSWISQSRASAHQKAAGTEGGPSSLWQTSKVPGGKKAPEKQILSNPSGLVGAACPRDEASQRECRMTVPRPGDCLPCLGTRASDFPWTARIPSKN